ncbi:MAG: AAA family ATPase, partial [Pseudonocardia sp.]|nr:AAA family ATPase [Pseudonocardia sp.]
MPVPGQVSGGVRALRGDRFPERPGIEVNQMFVGRIVERAVLDRLLEALRLGESQALVVYGEAGIGKSALLEYLVDRASACRVARAAGVESRMELPFAGLHQLCAAMVDRDDALPAPQRRALRTALGLGAGPPPDRFLVGLALLGLFAEVARERPLVCVVDDIQWFDRASAQALTFVARRLEAESVALVLATRATEHLPELASLPRLEVAGLPDSDARKLLTSVLTGPMDRHVLDRVVAETRGNPLALLELPRGLTASELVGGFEPAGASGSAAPVVERIEDSYQHQLAVLPEDTRRLLLVAAAEPLGDPGLLWRAATRLGIGPHAAAPAVEAGLLTIDGHVRFRHPLLRSAIYRAAPAHSRRRAHRELAQVSDPDADPDRRAWHAAQASSGPDEDIAADLERLAWRAQARGGLAAAAAFLQRGVELTDDPARRIRRALDAAEAVHQAGSPDAALRLLTVAEAGTPDDLARARADLLRAQVAFTERRSEAPTLLLTAATRLGPLQPASARETYLQALSAATLADPLANGVGPREVAEAARAAPTPPSPARAVDLLLDGSAMWFTEGFQAAAPKLKQAVAAFRDPRLPAREGLRWLWYGCRTAEDLWDERSWEALAARQVRLARDVGALSTLPFALSIRMAAHVCTGELAEAEALGYELRVATEATGSPSVPYPTLMLTAWQGREAEAAELAEATLADVALRGEGIGLAVVAWTTALLRNGLCRHQDALVAARQATERGPESGMPTWGSLVELVEAASRVGRTEEAAAALHRLTEVTDASGTEWALGTQARSRALLGAGAGAANAYHEAIDRLERTRARGELARAHLLYGEWLRRQ